MANKRPDPAAPQGKRQGFDRALFDTRVAGFATATDAYEFQAFLPVNDHT